MTAMTKSQTVAADVSALLRARNPLLWIVTREEARVERYIVEAAASASYRTRTWDSAQGAAEIDGSLLRGTGDSKDVGEMLNIIKSYAERSASQERCAWVMRDMHEWLNGPLWSSTRRQLRNLVRSLPGTARASAQAIIVLSPSSDIPKELEGQATVIDWPLPDRAEIGAILDAAIESLPETMKADAAPNGQRDAAVDAAIGLTGDEAAACYAKSLVQLKRIDPLAVTKEKRRVIAREKVLEWIEPLKGGLDAVGGLDDLKTWLVSRSSAYSPKARAYGLPSPKGMLLIGPPGTGKSMTAKAAATAWGIPLLKLDLGALKSKWVGQSESNLRRAFAVIEAIGRCVVWIDEIEKALAGATQGAADGGVSADALGAILNWMQERQGEAFVVATSNDVSILPPELMRKGRFDETWWIDLPNWEERNAILRASLKANGRDPDKIDNLKAIATVCEKFSGAEIAAIVPDAMFAAFADGEREITTADLIASAKTVVPGTVTSSEKIEKLREWAKGRARAASRADEHAPVHGTGRVLDL
jgi:ATPase family associated with various cellular activities (AAA)/AAA+ lid domain